MQTSLNLASKLKPRMANEFQRRLLEATMQSAQAEGNPLRLNHFSASFRELFRHVLVELAPDAKVKASSWYVPDKTSKTGVTRGHKIAYVIHGGLDPSYVESELEIDIVAEKAALLKEVDRLNRFTHVNEDSFDMPAADVEAQVYRACLALTAFLDCADEARRVLGNKVSERVHNDVVQEAIRETLLAVDEISSHHSVDTVDVYKIEVTSLEHDEIHFIACGSVGVELQWGSNGDIRRGDGAVMNESFPLTCKFVSPVRDPEGLEVVEGSLYVDTSSWWDGNYDEGEAP